MNIGIFTLVRVPTVPQVTDSNVTAIGNVIVMETLCIAPVAYFCFAPYSLRKTVTSVQHKPCAAVAK